MRLSDRFCDDFAGVSISTLFDKGGTNDDSAKYTREQRDENVDKVNEESIDLGRLMRIMVARKVVIGGILAACIIVALGVALSMPKKYESTAIVQIRNIAIDADTTASNMVARGINIENGSQIGILPMTYVELMKSRSVMEAANKRSKSMAEEKGIEPVVISNYHVANKKQTNLISITGTGKTPAEAQLIAKCLVDGFLDVQTKKNQETQMQLIQVIDERIEAAQQEGNRELYEHLQRQREQHKIQLAMPSMDIQLIDPPNLPDVNAPSAPRKGRILAIGFVFGCLLSLGYGLYCYKREG